MKTSSGGPHARPTPGRRSCSGAKPIRTSQPRPLENTIVLVDPRGNLVWKFLKAHPVPGGEAAISIPADGRLKFADTPFGRLSSVICFDADSVQLLHQAGQLSADLVLVPSNDWRAIDPWHTQIAVFRAVEQGFN